MTIIQLCYYSGKEIIQLVGDSNQVIAEYVSKYITKTEKSFGIIEQLQSCKSLLSNLWSFSLRAISNRECGSLEAADTLLGHKIYDMDSSTKIRWLNVNVVRNRKLKTYEELKNLPEDSTDIFCNNFIDTHYPNRHDDLELTSLYQFAKHYDVIKDKPIYKAEYKEMKNGGYSRRRKNNPYLINFYKNNPITEPEKYYYSLLLLFKPWRSEETLKGQHNTYFDAFKAVEAELPEATNFHNKYLNKLEVNGHIKQLIEDASKEDTQSSQKVDSDSYPEGCVPLGVEDAMKDFHDCANKDDNETLTQIVNELNTDQSRIFNKVTTALMNGKLIKIFVSGPGGTGKVN